jgi:NAD(P)-dependent dehydrogenase (short-subunit alcohol dehydrogenase family)
MADLEDKVAVVTGAASGIGRATARRLAEAGMRVVLADVERPALDEAAHEIARRGRGTLAVPTDVSSPGDVVRLADTALAEFGSVHVVFNNAGVALFGPVWEATLEDWYWVLGVNLWGVIHGVRTFVPILLRPASPARAPLLRTHPSGAEGRCAGAHRGDPRRNRAAIPAARLTPGTRWFRSPQPRCVFPPAATLCFARGDGPRPRRRAHGGSTGDDRIARRVLPVRRGACARSGATRHPPR